MKYWLMPVFLFAAAAQAHADPLVINRIYHYQTPLIDVVAGVQVGGNNSMEVTQQSAINVYRVHQIGPVSTANVTQNGYNNRAAVVQFDFGLPLFIPSVP